MHSITITTTAPIKTKKKTTSTGILNEMLLLSRECNKHILNIGKRANQLALVTSPIFSCVRVCPYIPLVPTINRAQIFCGSVIFTLEFNVRTFKIRQFNRMNIWKELTIFHKKKLFILHPKEEFVDLISINAKNGNTIQKQSASQHWNFIWTVHAMLGPGQVWPGLMDVSSFSKIIESNRVECNK